MNYYLPTSLTKNLRLILSNVIKALVNDTQTLVGGDKITKASLKAI